MAAAAASSASAEVAAMPDFSYEQFEQLCGPQLVGSGVPSCLWTCLYSKLKNQRFDAGEVFALAAPPGDDDEDEGEEGEEEGEKKQKDDNAPPKPYLLVAAADLSSDDVEEQVWLLDHAWTFRAKEAAPMLDGNAQLRARVAQMLLGTPTAARTEDLLRALWPRAHHYRVASERQLDEESCWYLLDEVGTAIERIVVPAQPEGGDEADAENPADYGVNVAVAPLYYPPANAAFSVVWFIDHDKEDFEIEAGTVIACDVARGIAPDKRARTAARYDFAFEAHLDEIVARALAAESPAAVPAPLQACAAALKAREERLAKVAASHKAQVDELLQTRAAALDQPNGAGSAAPLPVAPQLHTNGSGAARVWTDHQQIIDNFASLPAAQYKLVDDPSTADIVWSSFAACNPAIAPRARYVAEYHNENRFCNKSMLAQTMHDVFGPSSDASAPSAGIIPTTFDANLELDAFVAHYVFNNKRAGKDNLWISKPHCMARSLDMCISEDLRFLLRIGETGPKILCKYIDRPATLRGRKFDLRLCALVRNFRPEGLEVYLHDKVWVRTAATPYDKTGLHEYEKHFTVMNYSGGGQKLLNLLHDDFLREFDAEKGEGAWARAYALIKQMLRRVFIAISVAHGAELEESFFSGNNEGAAADVTAPRGHVVQRRALYGIDLMLDEDLKPFLLEITFSPDINRACKFFPTFVADTFATLFGGHPTSCERLC